MTPSLKIDLELIRQLEVKMLPNPNGRDKSESPKVALTRAECLIYADYLDQCGQKQSAAFFRLEGDAGLYPMTVKSKKKGAKKSPDQSLDSVELF